MRLPLEMAALLHDCGMSVNFKGHHKHGEYIVRNATLGSISDELQTIVACLVRYHGKSKPEPHHKLYASLTQRQRRRVRELSAILRIAAGLDEGGMQLVWDVDVRARGRQVRIRLRMAGRIAPRSWGRTSQSAAFRAGIWRSRAVYADSWTIGRPAPVGRRSNRSSLGNKPLWARSGLFPRSSISRVMFPVTLAPRESNPLKRNVSPMSPVRISCAPLRR